MKGIQLMASATALLVVIGFADARAELNPMASEVATQNYLPKNPGLTKSPISTSGSFEAIVDFSTLSLTPRGRNCLLEVDGRLVFAGTVEGVARGTTTALVFAPCSEVQANPPGTFADVFKSELDFEGTIDGEQAQASLLYQGRSQEGGQIEGRLIFSRGVQGALDVDAQLAVGGSYDGSVVVR